MSNVHRWYMPGVGSYSRPDPFPRGFSLAEGYYHYAIGNPLRFTDPFGLFEIDPSCSDCLNPILVRDTRQLSGLILKEVGAFCGSQLDTIQDVNLRRCINDSCNNGKIVCSKGEDNDLCSDPANLGYTRSAGGAIGHILRRVGLMKPIREAVLCANNAANFAGEAGTTVIHEWAHGCGYDPDPKPIPGIPHID